MSEVEVEQSSKRQKTGGPSTVARTRTATSVAPKRPGNALYVLRVASGGTTTVARAKKRSTHSRTRFSKKAGLSGRSRQNPDEVEDTDVDDEFNCVYHEDLHPEPPKPTMAT